MYAFTTARKMILALMILLFPALIMASNSAPALYVKPDLDLTTYNKVLITPLNLDNTRILKPVWDEDNKEEWTLKIKDLKIIQDLFMDAMHNELETIGGYTLVTTAATDALLIEVEILSITPYVKPGARVDDDGQVIETLGSGDLVFSAELRNSETRELLILVEGERTIGEKYRKLSMENHMKNLAGLFRKWGTKVRESLDENRK